MVSESKSTSSNKAGVKISKRQQILDSALELFNQHGFEATPTSAISKHAGVATGTLFHHFASKEALINALYLQLKSEIYQALTEPMAQAQSLTEAVKEKRIDQADAQAELKQVFEQLWQTMMAWWLKQPQKFQFFSQFGHSALIDNSTREHASQMFAQAESLFDLGKKLQLFPTLPTTLLSGLLSNHMFTCCHYLLENPSLWRRKHNRHLLFLSCWQQLASTGNNP